MRYVPNSDESFQKAVEVGSAHITRLQDVMSEKSESWQKVATNRKLKCMNLALLMQQLANLQVRSGGHYRI